MSKRKRLKKGLASVAQQIELHKEKLKRAEAEEMSTLAEYYRKEIERLENDVERRKRMLTKKQRKSRS